MEGGEVDSKTDQDPSILEVKAMKRLNMSELKVSTNGVKNVVKMGHAPKIAAEEDSSRDLEHAVRETKKNFSTDLHLLMTETTNDPNLLKTLVV